MSARDRRRVNIAFIFALGAIIGSLIGMVVGVPWQIVLLLDVIVSFIFAYVVDKLDLIL